MGGAVHLVCEEQFFYAEGFARDFSIGAPILLCIFGVEAEVQGVVGRGTYTALAGEGAVKEGK